MDRKISQTVDYTTRECRHIQAVRRLMWDNEVTFTVSQPPTLAHPQLKCAKCRCITDLESKVPR